MFQIKEQSGKTSHVGGKDFPSVATIHENLFLHRPAYQTDVIIRYCIADIQTPSGIQIKNQILMSYEFDDGAIVFAGYQPVCEECNGTGLSLRWSPVHGTYTDICHECHVEPETSEPYASGRLY